MLIIILNIYNPLNKIKFTKEKKIEKKIIYLVLNFLKVKYHTKIIIIKINKDKSLHDPHSKY